MKNLLFVSVSLLVFLLPGCAIVNDHPKMVNDLTDQKLTLGKVQRELSVGMSQIEVVKALGSPNMVTRDRDGIETWIYDKISTETVYSSNNNGVQALILSASSSSGAISRTQKTLTIIVKFNKLIVSEFTYNATTF